MPGEFKHIVRIAGKDLRGERRVQLALTDIKGVGTMMARAVAYAAEVDPMVKLGNLSKEEIGRLEDVVSKPQAHGIPNWMLDRRKDEDSGKDIHIVGSDIDRAVRADIAKERRIRSRRGIRHELGLPVRGQRTRSTGRVGMTVGVKRKEIRIREAESAAKKGEAPPRRGKGAPKEKVEKAEKAAPKAEKAAVPKAEEKKEKKVEKKTVK
jgi:small subunit ribosomal protein S13